MEIKRKIYNKLINWKNTSNGEKALLIEGARRVGKSTLVEEFAKNEYKSYILIDFNNVKKQILENYENLNNLDLFFQNIMLQYNTRLYKRESIIIFDEIQKFPRAREAIKYLVKDGRYDYIETGSLISIKENVNDITIPSEEQKIKMYPVDFEEFLTYMNEEILIGYIKECWQKKVPLDNDIHKKAMRLFYEYILVGGMPMPLVKYKNNNKDFFLADIEKRDILNLYKDDIKKATKKYNSRVSAIFEKIPSYLSTHEKRVVLKKIDPNGKFENYDDPLFWLEDSMICNLCYKTTDPNVGLSFNTNDSYVKCYMGDTGLLFSHAFNEVEIKDQELYRQIIDGKLSINKGMLFENVIAQIITSSNRKLYFYTRFSEENHRNDIEIDFILSNDSKTNFKIYPIEVKSGKNYSTTSLDAFNIIYCKRISNQFIVHPKNFTTQDNKFKLPPYMFALILDDLY